MTTRSKDKGAEDRWMIEQHTDGGLRWGAPEHFTHRRVTSLCSSSSAPLHPRHPSCWCGRYVRSLITCMQTQAKTRAAAAACSRKRFVSASRPLQSSFLLPFPHLHFLIKAIVISFRGREEVSHGGEVTLQIPGARSPSRSAIKQICAVSTVHNLCATFPRGSPHLSEQTPPPRERAAATSCVYITHHLLHGPIRSRSREADLEST